MRTIKIYFLPAWLNNEKEMAYLFIRQTPGCSGKWGNLEITNNLNKADYHICMGGPRSIVFPDPKRTIFLTGEPTVKNGHWECEEHDVCMKFLFNKGQTFFTPLWLLDATYDELKNMKPPTKTKQMSCVLSYKVKCKGHHIRHDFARNICSKYYDLIDLYGSVVRIKGFEDLVVGEKKEPKRCKKIPHHICKIDTLKDYRYHLAMENCQELNYFTEKIGDAFLMWSYPFYWGCPNIDEFFPKESYSLFNAKNINDAENVINTIKNHQYEKSLDFIEEARNLILDKYNVMPLLHQAINEGKITWKKYNS